MPIKTGLVGTAPVRFAVDSGGQVYCVNGVDQPFVWDGVSATTARNWGIVAPAVPALGAIGAGVLTGTYYYQVTWYNSNTGEYGAPSGASAAAVLTADSQTVNRPTIAGIDPQVTHWRLWRTTAGQASVYYLVTTELTSAASYADNVADTVVSAAAAMDEHYPPDPTKPYIRFYKGRFILYGSRIERAGTVTLTNAALTVAGAGTNFRASHVGQRLYVAGESVYYTIATVTNATTATIATNYAGATAGGKTFRLVTVRPSDVAWSQADSESFALLSSTGVFPADGDLPTGLEVVGTSLVLFKQSHAYMFDYGSDPNPLTGSGNLSQLLAPRGLIRQECCVPVGQKAFCLDSQGIYEFDGSALEKPIDQLIRRMFHPDDEIRAAYRINRAYSDQWHGVYDQRTDSVCFFVTMGAETAPQTALRWTRGRQQWTMDKFEQSVAASCQGRDSNGEYRAWIGDANKWVWALSGTRQAEGHSTGTLEGTATAGAAATLTDSAAAFTTTGSGLQGVYVRTLTGTGLGQTRLITSNTGTVLTVSPNWTVNPAAGTTYVVAAVESIWRSVWHFSVPDPALQMKQMWLLYSPNAATRTFKVRLYRDFLEAPIKTWRVSGPKDGLTIPPTVSSDGWIEIDGHHPIGRVRLMMTENFTTCFAVELSMIGAAEPLHIRGYDMEAVQVPKEFE